MVVKKPLANLTEMEDLVAMETSGLGHASE